MFSECLQVPTLELVYKVRYRTKEPTPHLNFFLNKLKKNISSDLISAYPEFAKIYKKLSKKLKISSENLVFTAGSDQAIKIL